LKFSKLYWDIVSKIISGRKNPESIAPEVYSIKITEKEIIFHTPMSPVLGMPSKLCDNSQK